MQFAHVHILLYFGQFAVVLFKQLKDKLESDEIEMELVFDAVSSSSLLDIIFINLNDYKNEYVGWRRVAEQKL